MSYRLYEDPTEICCGQCASCHSAPACDAWRWAPVPVKYRLADGSPCIERGYRTGRSVAIGRLRTERYLEADFSDASYWEDIEF